MSKTESGKPTCDVCGQPLASNFAYGWFCLRCDAPRPMAGDPL